MVTTVVYCPHCGSEEIVRNGKAPNGKQKYRCKECKKQSREGSSSLEQDSQLCIVAMKKQEGFLSLLHNQKTMERIEAMLKTGKPLRN